jgi:antagonist of KipI
MSHVHVLRGGMLTTVQDRGRWGLQALGVPVAGPMDPYSHRVANALVGNDSNAATLEVTLLGPELEFEDERLIAVAGADFQLSVNGKAAQTGTPIAIGAGARLQFGVRRRGARAYVAIAGGIATLPVFGSRATHVISGMGGFQGRPLRSGDTLPLGERVAPRTVAPRTLAPRTKHPAPSTVAPSTAAPGTEHPAPSTQHPTPVVVRVLPGPQLESFVSGALEALQSAPYVVGQQSDRMGFRLDGPPLSHSRGAETISDATPLGVLQVPASGQPILLMADRQTAGGYPKIATVITADLAVAGQLGPGDRLRFVACTQREAMAALIAQERAIMAIESAS